VGKFINQGNAVAAAAVWFRELLVWGRAAVKALQFITKTNKQKIQN
jgi:hypothetical protein